jgi:hypothetical protein
VGIIAGIVVFREGKKIKKVEGIPVQEEEVKGDVERGEEAAGVTGKGEAGKGGKVDGEKVLGKVQNGVDGQVVSGEWNVDIGGEKPGLTRTTTAKTMGKGWYERH